MATQQPLTFDARDRLESEADYSLQSATPRPDGPGSYVTIRDRIYYIRSEGGRYVARKMDGRNTLGGSGSTMRNAVIDVLERGQPKKATKKKTTKKKAAKKKATKKKATKKKTTKKKKKRAKSTGKVHECATALGRLGGKAKARNYRKRKASK